MSRIYPFSVGEAKSSAWLVSVDGEYCPLHLARVSAYPIDRRWPGHQRSQEETELVAFALFEADKPVTLQVKPSRSFNEVIIRPLSKCITPKVEDGTISFTIPAPGAYTVELDGTHEALHIFADPVTEYPAVSELSDVVYYGIGVHDVGEIKLHSGQTLFIDEGAVVYARIIATDADNIRIIGHGILDGSRNVEEILIEMGEEQRKAFEDGWAVPNNIRRHTVELSYCNHVQIHGITIRDSLLYNIRPVCCCDLNIDNVKIIGNWRYNSDGIDMHNCRDVIIRNCFVRTYDDSICIKGFDYTQDEADMLHNGVLYNDFNSVLIEKCVIWCDWGRSLELGAETRVKSISNVLFRDCDLIHNTHIAMDVQNVDYADIHDVLFEDIRIEYPAVSQAPRLQMSDQDYYIEDPNSNYMSDLMGCHISYIPEYSARIGERGRIRDIKFRNIKVFAQKMPPSVFAGYDTQYKCERIHIDGLFLNGKRISCLQDACIRFNEFVDEITIC